MRISAKEYRELCEKGKLSSLTNKSSISKKINTAELEANKKRQKALRNSKPLALNGSFEEFIITGRLPGFNEIIAISKTHPVAYSEMKRMNSQIVMLSARKQLKYNYKRVKVEILWIEINRQRDKDNIAAAVKFILDGLVDAGIIEEDGWSQIESITNSYDVDKKNPRVIVKITECYIDEE